MNKQTQPTGIYAAALTPMNIDLSLNLKLFIKHCNWLLDNGCDGIAPLGTTGEANSLSIDERLSILESLADAGISGNKLIAGVGCCAFPDTITLTKRALECGAGGVLMLPPFYYKKPSMEGLFSAFANIVDKINDPELKIYLYNFPQQVGFELPIELVAKLHKTFPDTIVGMKDSSGDWPRMKKILKELPTFRLFPGSEEFLVPALRLGGVGCISATVNISAPYAGRVYKNWKESDADKEQIHVTRLRNAFSGMATIPAMKAYLEKTFGDTGWRTARPPFLQTTSADLAKASKRLSEANFSIPKS